jgi:hypothetical protein
MGWKNFPFVGDSSSTSCFEANQTLFLDDKTQSISYIFIHDLLKCATIERENVIVLQILVIGFLQTLVDGFYNFFVFAILNLNSTCFQGFSIILIMKQMKT